MKRLWLAAPLSLLALRADAVVTATWSVETYQQFDAGDATNAFITSAGELRPGWDTKKVKLEGDAVWSALRLADGSVLVGSDANGAIYKITGDSAKQVVKLEGAIAVVSLAQTSDGSVWAGAMPGNKLWKIDVNGGKATAGPVLKDVETIWSLAAAGDTVYAGTGPSGKLETREAQGTYRLELNTGDFASVEVTRSFEGLTEPFNVGGDVVVPVGNYSFTQTRLNYQFGPQRAINGGLTVAYGKAQVVHDVSLEVRPGELVVLLGRNGAGKSTILNAISGLIRKRAGRVRFEDRDVTAASPRAIVRGGLVQVLEGHRVFTTLSVEDNLRLRAALQHAGAMASDTVEMLLRSAGAFTTKKGNRLQRYFRDVIMYRTHNSAQAEEFATFVGRARLGRPVGMRGL